LIRSGKAIVGATPPPVNVGPRDIAHRSLR
jgi:hypothetical protein